MYFLPYSFFLPSINTVNINDEESEREKKYPWMKIAIVMLCTYSDSLTFNEIEQK